MRFAVTCRHLHENSEQLQHPGVEGRRRRHGPAAGRRREQGGHGLGKERVQLATLFRVGFVRLRRGEVTDGGPRT